MKKPIFAIRRSKKYFNWTLDQDRILVNEIKDFKSRNKWKIIAKKIGKKVIDCIKRYTVINPKIKKGAWTSEEDEEVLKLSKIYGKNWSKISINIKGKNRIGKQIRQRYLNFLDPNLNRTKFTIEEDMKILQLFNVYKSNWKFYPKHFDRRSADMIKGRYYSSVRYNGKILNIVDKLKVGNIDFIRREKFRFKTEKKIPPEKSQLNNIGQRINAGNIFDLDLVNKEEIIFKNNFISENIKKLILKKNIFRTENTIKDSDKFKIKTKKSLSNTKNYINIDTDEKLNFEANLFDAECIEKLKNFYGNDFINNEKIKEISSIDLNFSKDININEKDSFLESQKIIIGKIFKSSQKSPLDSLDGNETITIISSYCDRGSDKININVQSISESIEKCIDEDINNNNINEKIMNYNKNEIHYYQKDFFENYNKMNYNTCVETDEFQKFSFESNNDSLFSSDDNLSENQFIIGNKRLKGFNMIDFLI